MGNVLQIRVGAWTYDEDEVLKAWPCLSGIVWPQLDAWGPVGQRHGVIELAEHLSDALRFSDLPAEIKKELGPGAKLVNERLEQLRKALAAWEPREANSVSVMLEDALTELDRKAAELLGREKSRR